MLVIRLVEEHILAVVTLSGVLLQDTFAADSVLHAQLFPELVTDYAQTSIRIRCYNYLTYFGYRTGQLEA